MKKETLEKLFRAIVFFAIFFATVFLLQISFSPARGWSALGGKEQKTDIKSENIVFKNFPALKFDIKKSNPLSFEDKDKLALENQKTEDVFISQAEATSYKFNAIGVYWKEDVPADTQIKVEARLKNKSGWDDWRIAEPDDADQGKDPPRKDKRFADLIFLNEAEAFQYRVTLYTSDSSKTPTLKEIGFNYIDSTKGPKTSEGKTGLIKEAKAEPSVISRAGWGCSPSIGCDPNSSPAWSPEYESATHSVVHHTAGGWNTSDPASTVRAIWSYHANTRGWGDIGYNYLIDGYGNIYEGRFGGENVVAGHAFPYNRATIGISVMGDYSYGDISGAARNSLTELLAWKFGARNIDPLSGGTIYARYTVGGGGTTDAWGRSSFGATRIVGHRDVAPTSCPGNVFYSTIGTIRNITAQKWWNYAYPWQIVLQAAYTDRTLQTPALTTGLVPGQKVTLKLVIKNTSSRTWLKGGSNPTRLGTSNPRDRASIFADPSWLGPNRPTGIEENEVLPTQNATFIFDITAPPKGGEFREYFTPVIEGVSWMNEIGLNFYITISFDYRWQLVSQEAYTDETLVTPFDPIQTTIGQEPVLKLSARNIGSTTWHRGGVAPIHLGTSNPIDRKSSFYTPSWLDAARPTGLQEESVAQGGVGTFIFKIKAPLTPGIYREYFNLVAEGAVWMNDPGVNFYIVVSGLNYGAQFVSKNMPQVLYTGETYTTTISFKNTGNAIWRRGGANPVRLGSSNPQDRSSAFATSGWLGPNRPTSLNEDIVWPGSIGTFTFIMKAPDTPGTYNESFDVLAEGIKWFGADVTTSIRVKGTYKAEALDSGQTKSFVRGQETSQVTLSFKNIGTETWTKTGTSPVRLGASNPQDRNSVFATAGWLGPNRPAQLNESSVSPGSIGTFTFDLNTGAPAGNYNEYFAPLAERETWMNASSVVFVNVNPGSYSWQFISQTSDKNLVGLSPGETAVITLTAKNTGNTKWFRTGSYPVRVGASHPQDRSSPFADGTWLGSNRPVGIPAGTDTVAPGGQVTFSWNYRAPGVPGTYYEHFSLLAEGITWMNDPWVNYYTVVLGGPGVQVTGNVNYEVRDLSGNLLGQGGNWAPSNVYYINGNYYVVTPSSVGSTNTGVRFYPVGGHLIINSYYDPNWNGSANYNEFRGVIEVRYSGTSNALWVINELPLEDYLKGMAEALATSHPTHLRTMAIVERGYAYYHISRGGKHPGEPFHLKNSRQGNGDDQVYAGYKYETLAPAIGQASGETAGRVVFYGSSPVITLYFSRSDGRTRSALEAWGWTWAPWLISVPDPDCAGMSKLGHGVGLSAYGALKNAERGASYTDILGYYYRGTSLGIINNPNIRVAIYKIQY